MQQAVLEEALKVEGKRHRRRTVTPCLRVYFFLLGLVSERCQLASTLSRKAKVPRGNAMRDGGTASKT